MIPLYTRNCQDGTIQATRTNSTVKHVANGETTTLVAIVKDVIANTVMSVSRVIVVPSVMNGIVMHVVINAANVKKHFAINVVMNVVDVKILIVHHV